MSDKFDNDYNEIPYESLAYQDTHPDRLASLGRLFGLTPTDPQQCTLLELGCASGGNLIPMAYYNPRSRFFGVDLSSEQIKTARGLADRLRLTNVEFVAADLSEFSPPSTFDYIIAQGVFSWVSKQVRQALFQLINHSLAPDGLAYLSYNTLPGWRMRQALRDILLFHTKQQLNPKIKLEDSLQLLNKLSSAISTSAGPMVNVLQSEITHLKKAHPSYLYHEFLEKTNRGFFFSDVVDMAQSSGLTYVCDTELHTMFSNSHSGNSDQFVQAFDNNIDHEQYLDFVRVRPYRQSVFCRNTREPNFDIDISTLANIQVFADINIPNDLCAADSSEQTFMTVQGKHFQVSSPVVKVALALLSQLFPDAVPCEILYQAAMHELQQQHQQPHHQQDQQDTFYRELFNLIANNIISMTNIGDLQIPPPNTYPAATALAREETNYSPHLSTLRHTVINTDEFSQRLLNYADGKHSISDINNCLLADLRNRLLHIDTSGLDEHMLKESITANTNQLLQTFTRYGILT